MEFKQPSGKLLTPAIDFAHRLRDGGVNIATIADAFARAGFSEIIQKTVGRLIESEAGQGHKPCTWYQEEFRYQQQPSYPLD